MASRAVEIRRWGSKNQSARAEERLWRGWWNIASPGATICPRNHPNRAHQSTPWQPSSRTFRYWQNKRAYQPEILLAEPSKRYWGLCQRLWYMCGFKDSQTQALWQLAVLADINSLMEKPFDGFCYKITNFNQLKRWQLWLYSSHCWLAHKNGVLWASQGHHWCSRASQSYLRYGSLT